jgi:prolyl 4-hydroxylase
VSLYDPRRTTREQIWTVEDFFTKDECHAVIARAEAIGFGDAPITTARGMVMNKETRNNERVMFDDVPLAASLFERARPHVPAEIRERHAPPEAAPWVASGLNERLRVYRYHPGQRFRPHFDGSFLREEDVEESALTFMVYLDDDFVGGATAFLDDGIVIVPRTGMALFFFHPILHEGRTVERGVKHVLRTDVMYRRAK